MVSLLKPPGDLQVCVEAQPRLGLEPLSAGSAQPPAQPPAQAPAQPPAQAPALVFPIHPPLHAHRVILWCAQSVMGLFATLWTVACQAPLSMAFSRQEYCHWVAVSYFREIFLNQGSNPSSLVSPVLAGRFFITSTIDDLNCGLPVLECASVSAPGQLSNLGT